MTKRLFFERGRFCTLIFLLPLICLVTSCAFLQKREIDQKREQWTAQKITDYRYKIRLMAFNPDAGKNVQIEVRGGKQISLKCVECELKSNDSFTKLDTIEKLFDLIQRDLESGKYDVAVKYDETSGYPISIDVKSKEIGVTDSSWQYKISDFEIIK